jgi:flagellar biogenesis protein FliO
LLVLLLVLLLVRLLVRLFQQRNAGRRTIGAVATHTADADF